MKMYSITMETMYKKYTKNHSQYLILYFLVSTCTYMYINMKNMTGGIWEFGVTFCRREWDKITTATQSFHIMGNNMWNNHMHRSDTNMLHLVELVTLTCPISPTMRSGEKACLGMSSTGPSMSTSREILALRSGPKYSWKIIDQKKKSWYVCICSILK